MSNETKSITESKSFFVKNIDSIICTIGFLLIIKFGNLALAILGIIAYLAFVLEFVSRNDYRVGFRILSITSIISFIIYMFTNEYNLICYIVFITNVIAFFLIKLFIIYERNKLFEDNCWQIAEKYKEAAALLKQHNASTTYKKLIDNIYKEDKNLYLSSIQIRNALSQVNKLIEDMNKDDSFKPKKKMFVKDSGVDSDKLYNTNKYMKVALEKQKLYSDYISEVDEAIKATGTDFLNVRAELELSDLSKVNVPELSLSKLEERSKTLAYIQSHLPIIN